MGRCILSSGWERSTKWETLWLGHRQQHKKKNINWTKKGLFGILVQCSKGKKGSGDDAALGDEGGEGDAVGAAAEGDGKPIQKPIHRGVRVPPRDRGHGPLPPVRGMDFGGCSPPLPPPPFLSHCHQDGEVEAGRRQEVPELPGQDAVEAEVPLQPDVLRVHVPPTHVQVHLLAADGESAGGENGARVRERFGRGAGRGRVMFGHKKSGEVF